MGRLDGKVCIVVGAGARDGGVGTGCATAVVFAREGGRVLVVDRDSSAASCTREMIAAEGGEAEVFVGDITQEASAAGMVDAALRHWGTVDVLDNNIGVQQFGTVVDATESAWDAALSSNLKPVIFASKYAIPVMVDNGGGSVVNISSISAYRPRGDNAPYSTAKGAIIALTAAMAVDHGAAGVRVNCVVPGPIFTPMALDDGLSDERREQRRLASTIKREGTGWDVAYAALFFACDESRYITGAVLPVEGGVMLRTPDR